MYDLPFINNETNGDGLMSFCTYNCTYILQNRAYFLELSQIILNVNISKKYAFTLKAKKINFLVICLVQQKYFFNIVKQACLLAPMKSLGLQMCISMDYCVRLFIGAKKHACFTTLKNYFYHTKHITSNFIFLAFRVSAYFLEIFTFGIIYDNSKKYALFFRMYVQLYIRKLIRPSPDCSIRAEREIVEIEAFRQAHAQAFE